MVPSATIDSSVRTVTFDRLCCVEFRRCGLRSDFDRLITVCYSNFGQLCKKSRFQEMSHLLEPQLSFIILENKPVHITYTWFHVFFWWSRDKGHTMCTCHTGITKERDLPIFNWYLGPPRYLLRPSSCHPLLSHWFDSTSLKSRAMIHKMFSEDSR